MSNGFLAFAVSRDGYATMWLKKTVRCACGRAVVLVVNRDGETRCCYCDGERERAKERHPALKDADGGRPDEST